MNYEIDSLHEARLEAVSEQVLALGAKKVLDLGCGSGDLILRMSAHEQICKIIGIDISFEILAEARKLLKSHNLLTGDRIQILCSSFLNKDEIPTNFDAAILMETIEHIHPKCLSVLEDSVFNRGRPKAIIITTPNKEYNEIYGMSDQERRHPGHYFEWGRKKFESWTQGVALRQNYYVDLFGVGPFDKLRGCPTQMALFTQET